MNSIDWFAIRAPLAVHAWTAFDRIALARLVFALGVVGLGLQQVLLVNFAADLAPVPASLANRAAGAALLHVPKLIGSSHDVGAWVGAFELLTLVGVALALVATTRVQPSVDATWHRLIDRVAMLGIVCVAASSLVFGAVHFLYAQAIANLIPSWIPGALTWAYGLGAARIITGMALVVPRWQRLAAGFLAAMYGAWVLILHVPRIIASGADASEWTFMLLAVAFCGGSWLIAAASMKRRLAAPAQAVSRLEPC